MTSMTHLAFIKLTSNNVLVDGLRIDTVKHVQKSFWPGYNSAAGVYCVGEVFDGDPAYACDYQNYVNGILNYPMCVTHFSIAVLGC